jgi:hypothetical protein
MWKRRYGEEKHTSQGDNVEERKLVKTKHTSKGDNVEERKLVKKNTHQSTQCGGGKMASKTKICDLKFELCVGFSSFDQIFFLSGDSSRPFGYGLELGNWT